VLKPSANHMYHRLFSINTAYFHTMCFLQFPQQTPIICLNNHKEFPSEIEKVFVLLFWWLIIQAVPSQNLCADDGYSRGLSQ